MENPYKAPESNLSAKPVADAENTSGMGKDAVLPEGIAGWSWGAFFWNWIWGGFNKTYIGFLCLVPYVGFVMAIVLGVKGREWAWRNKRWDSVDHFQTVQRKWSYAAAIFFFGLFALIFLAVIVGVLFGKH